MLIGRQIPFETSRMIYGVIYNYHTVDHCYRSRTKSFGIFTKSAQDFLTSLVKPVTIVQQIAFCFLLNSISVFFIDELTAVVFYPRKPFAFHSVSGMVVRADGRILMVREQRRYSFVPFFCILMRMLLRFLAKLYVRPYFRRKFWKFPGGMPIEDENLKETATRKVMEKTGVVAEAKTIIGVK